MTGHQALFERWYRKPLMTLEELEHGDGGFVALATSCFLYERYAKALLKKQGKKADDAGLVSQFAADFSVDLETAWVFWDTIRNGFLHQAMPKTKQHGGTLRRWSTSQGYRVPVDLVTGPRAELHVQPWRFRDRVLELWAARPDLIGANESFPWADIFEGSQVNDD